MVAIQAHLSEDPYQCRTFVSLLKRRASQQPSQIAYFLLEDGEYESHQLTYKELDRQARGIAAKLQSCAGLSERILMLYPPGLEFIAAFFGCLYAGTIAVPSYPSRRNQTLSRLQAIIASSQPMVALTTASVMQTIVHRYAEAPELTTMQWLVTGDRDDELAEQWQEPLIQGNTLAFLQYTSGSTGMPKGVMVSHSNLLHNSAAISQSFGDTCNSIGVNWLPPYHDMGLIGGLLQPIFVGAPTILMSPLSFMQKPYRWLQAISRYRATHSGGPNFAYDLCVNRITQQQRAALDLSSWEVAFTGAEPVRARTLEKFAATFANCGFRQAAFHPCYGLAESTLFVSGGRKLAPLVLNQVDRLALTQNRIVGVDSERDSKQVLVSCGQSQLNEVAIVDPQTLAPHPERTVGEIWVSGPSVAQGYWQRSQETQQTFHAYLSTGEGPFLRTGDLGFLQDGELYVTGRLKDIIIIRGQNYYPQDIELTVEASHPALGSNCSAAFALEIKGQERLIVVAEVTRSYRHNLPISEIADAISQAVAAQYALQVYAIALLKTGSLPRTPSGKIQRYAARSGFLTGTLEVLEDWSENPQNKSKFVRLQSEVESVFQQLIANKLS